MDLRTERTYAASVVMPDETLWILGGVGKTKVLDTTEILSYTRLNQSKDASNLVKYRFYIFSLSMKWSSKWGPKMPFALLGHCAAKLSPNELIIAGGYNAKTNDYSDLTYILNTKTYVRYLIGNT